MFEMEIVRPCAADVPAASDARSGCILTASIAFSDFSATTRKACRSAAVESAKCVARCRTRASSHWRKRVSVGSVMTTVRPGSSASLPTRQLRRWHSAKGTMSKSGRNWRRLAMLKARMPKCLAALGSKASSLRPSFSASQATRERAPALAMASRMRPASKARAAVAVADMRRFPFARALLKARRQVEDRQVHEHDDRADHEPDENHQSRLEEPTGQLHRTLQARLMKLRDPFEDFGQGARALGHREHAAGHRIG